jgi:hypothetical protein
VETEHSKEGTNVQLSVRGKMLPAQVSSSDAVVYMCGELDSCSVSNPEGSLVVPWGCGGVVCAVCCGTFVSTHCTLRSLLLQLQCVGNVLYLSLWRCVECGTQPDCDARCVLILTDHQDAVCGDQLLQGALNGSRALGFGLYSG